MKLTVLTSRYPDPSETFIESEIRALRDAGHEVRVLSLKPGEGADPDVRRVLWWDPANLAAFVMAGLRKPKAMWAIFRELAGGFGDCPRSGERFKSFAVWPLATRLALEVDRPVFAHWANVPSTIAWIMSRLEAHRYAMEIHGENVSTVWRHLTVKCHEADLVATCSRFTAAALATGGIDDVVLLPHGVEIPGPSSIQASAVPRLLSVGRLVPTKGLATTVRALGRLRRSGRRVRWTCVGDGPDRAELERLVRQEGLVTEVRFTGWLSHEETRRLYHEHDLFILPCETDGRGDSDGLPNVILEAMAAGLPVVSSPTGGILEAVTDGETGYLVEPGDEAALAERLATVLADRDRMQEIGRTAREFVEKTYSAGDCRGRVVETLTAWAR